MVSAVTGRAVGKHKRGAARMNQMMVTLNHQPWLFKNRCLYSHVAEVTDLALVEWSILDLLSTSEEGKRDRDTAGTTETDDGDTEESIEGSGRSKVDTSQGHLDGSVEEEGVQWHFETLRDSAP
jgi:hypothetical protein